MEALIELACVGAAWLIYGSPTNPRHPAVRTAVRVLAFCGLIVAVIKLALWPAVAFLPRVLTGLWAFLALTVAMAEYEVGSKAACLVMALGLMGLLALGLWQGV